MKIKSSFWPAILITAFLLVGIALLFFSERLFHSESDKSPAESEIRNPNWAKPIRLEGVPNFFQIDDNVYRSAQPTAEGFRNLQKIGVKTVINLRAFHSDKDEIQGTNLKSEEISFKAWHPEKEDIIKFIKIIQTKDKGPFLIHCQHGADRTGMMSAIYRMYFQEWSNDEALDEMKNGGYGFHSVWKNISSYLQNLNIEKIKQDI